MRFCYVLPVLLCAAGLSACDTEPPAAPTGVVLPAGPTSAQVAGWTVAGTVWLHQPHGVAPASGGTVVGWVESRRLGHSTGRVPVDTDGSYRFQVSDETTRVYVKSGVRGYQPCPATATPTGDVTLDVHVVTDPGQLNGNLPGMLQSQQPALSGQVYEQTSAGRQPLADAWVTLDPTGGMGVLIGETLSDADGRYVLCGLPQVRDLAVVVGRAGYEVFYSSGDLTGRTTLDIEMRRSAK